MPTLSTRAPMIPAPLRNAAHGANDIYWFILPPVLPLILQEFGLRYAGVGGVVTVYLSVIALSSLLMGRLSDRIPRRLLIAAGFAAASVSLWLAAVSPSLGLVVACLVPAAIGVSTFHPAAYAAIHDAHGASGRSYGAFECAGALAVAIMFLVHGALVSRLGWRGVLAVGAVPGAVVAALLLRGGRAGASSSGSPPAAGAATPTAGLVAVTFFVVAVMLRFLGTTALSNFYPTYLVRTAGMSPGLASMAMASAFLGSAGGALLSGRAAERWRPAPVFLVSSVVLVPSALALSLGLPAAVYPVLLVVFGLSISGCIPAQNMLMNQLTKGRAQGRVFGVVMGMTTVAASLSPLLFGAIADQAGLTMSMRLAVVPLAAAPAVAAAVLLPVARANAAARP